MKAVPFYVDLGLSTVQGVLRLEKTHLAIEWRTFDVLGSPTNRLKGISIPYEKLERIEYRKRLGRAKVEVHTSTPTSFQGFPLPEGSITTLSAAIKRRNRTDAEYWAAEATLRLAEFQ